MIKEGGRALDKPSWAKNDPLGTSSVKIFSMDKKIFQQIAFFNGFENILEYIGKFL